MNRDQLVTAVMGILVPRVLSVVEEVVEELLKMDLDGDGTIGFAKPEVKADGE